MSVQFDPVPLLASVRAGELYTSWRDAYPTVSQRPEMEPLPPVAGEGGLLIRLGDPIGGRLWFEASDGAYLVQLQANRLALNWRRVGNAAYPRYPAVAERFDQAWRTLATLPDVTITPNRTEVTYVNVIPRPPHEVIAGWVNPVCTPGAGTVQSTFDQLITLESGVVARCSTSIVGSFAEQEHTRLTLSVISDMSDDAQDVVHLQRVAHDWIVRRFKDITAEDMHREWGEET